MGRSLCSPLLSLSWYTFELMGEQMASPEPVAASLASMEGHRKYLRLEKRSAKMAPHLKQLGRRIVSATDPERFEGLLWQVDENMLRETQDWLMLMRYVEIKAG